METMRLGTYVNGNTIVVMYTDGTKIRYVRTGQKPAPEYPESIDLKLTNRCELGCPMCSEQSTPDGTHAVLNDLPSVNDSIIDSIKPYTELAIGGGNPLTHPQLEGFLWYMHSRNVICNLTVNAVHFMDNIALLKKLCDRKLIYGLGISVPTAIPDRLIPALKDFPNAVIHTIAGVTPPSVYDHLADHSLNLLILGFKTKGKGYDYFLKNHVATNLYDLSDCIKDMRSRFKAIAFDNLAVEQLNLRDIFPDEFDELYMGDDGDFTMYIDLVAGKYGKSSTHPLRDIDAGTVTELFQKLKEDAEEIKPMEIGEVIDGLDYCLSTGKCIGCANSEGRMVATCRPLVENALRLLKEKNN